MRKTDISEQKFLFHQGTDHRSYRLFGAHQNDSGYTFRVWAPRAASVSLVGSFNDWDPAALPMHQLADDSSIWEVTTDRVKHGDMYKFAIKNATGEIVYKADPYAFYSEAVPFEEGGQRASRVWDIGLEYEWHDGEYLAKRAGRNPYRLPMSIYEVHLGSWRRKEDGSFLNYRELADKLIPYAVDMGYTHLELLPVMEFPYEGSWGYQITGYYCITSRYGTPQDFKYFVDTAHQAGLGVIFDWVPAHFPKDGHGLARFDGQPLYEYADPLKMEHKGWGTLSFDFGRPEVISFLISNAFFYCDEYHADGLRVDAVSAMLYLNYDRREGEWRPNEDGGTENKEAIKFLQNLNHSVLSEFPGVLMIAEESTAFPNVTKPPQLGGLGFNFKWNMGWMNDALEYFAKDPLFRRGSHHQLTFSMTYAYSENFVLPISHDEVVHGKRSMLDKMPGEYDDKFKGLRAFYVYMMTHPGKKLMFMGAEFAQFIEWNEKQSLDWLLLGYDRHNQMQQFVRDLNKIYVKTPALWEADDSYDGFSWIDADACDNNVYVYARMAASGAESDDQALCVVALNLSGNDFDEYAIGVPACEEYKLLIHSDLSEYGGSSQEEAIAENYDIEVGECNGFEQHITVRLPKLSAIVVRGK